MGALDCRSSLKGVNFLDTSGFRRHLQVASLPSYINFAYSPNSAIVSLPLRQLHSDDVTDEWRREEAVWVWNVWTRAACWRIRCHAVSFLLFDAS